MSNPFDFFDKIYCVNLPKSKDRWIAISKEFEKVGIINRVERIWATPPCDNLKVSSMKRNPAAEIGVGLSHLKVIAHGLASNAKNILIFEDDIIFIENYNNKLTAAINELPLNWDLLYIGGTPLGNLTKISNNLAKISNGFMGAYAYCLSKKAMLKLYDYSIDNITSKPYDYSTRWLSNNSNAYAIAPYICIPGKHQEQSTISNSTNGAGTNKIITKKWKQYLK